MWGIKANRRIFQSKFLALSLIFSFILLITIEAAPRDINYNSDKEFNPVVKVRETQQEISEGQKEVFNRLIEEGKKLLQEQMDYEGAINKFKDAKTLAVTREQKADAFFYLSLAHYATIEEKGDEDFNEATGKLIEIDYYRELDTLLCPPRYVELFRGIKKEFGALRIQSKPTGADVYINESRDPAGKTPVTIGAKAGTVKIRVKKGNKEKRDTLQVVAGKETTSPAYILKGKSSLIYVIGGIVLAGGVVAAVAGGGGGGNGGGAAAPTTGSIQVNSNPSGAKVYLDGTDTGRTTNTTLTSVSPGSHTIKLEKEGYKSYEGSVSVTAGQTATVSADLEKHTLNVTKPTSGTTWWKNDEVEITWSSDASLSSYGNAGIQGSINLRVNPNGKLTYSNPRGSFQSSSPSQGLMKAGQNSVRINASRKGMSQGRIGNIGGTKEIRSSQRTSLPVYPRSSIMAQSSFPQALNLAGNQGVYILTNVKIELYKGGNRVLTIVSSTDNDGSYRWTVSTDPTPGSDFKVRVSCVDDNGVYGESERFEITDFGEIKIFSNPTGAQVYLDGNNTGRTTNCTLTNVSPGSHTINLVKEGYEYYEISVSVTAGQTTTVDAILREIIAGDYVFITKWGSEGSGDGQFNHPDWIAVDNSGYVYVSDDQNQRIQKFTSDGEFVIKWGSGGRGGGQFSGPRGIAADNSGYVYVADTGNHCIHKFTSSGSFITKWGNEGSGDGQFSDFEGIAVDNSGYVYAADTHNHRIQKFTSDGAFVTKWGSYGSSDGQFNEPHGIVADAYGYVYVTDKINCRVQKFTSNGTFVTKWGGQGFGDGLFHSAWGIATDSAGYVYVVDAAIGRIQKFTSSGIFVTKWGSQGTGDGQFYGPIGIAVDGSGYVYVVEWENNRVQKFGPASAVQKITEMVYSPFRNQFFNRNLKQRPGHLIPSSLNRLELKQRFMNKKVS